MWAILLTRTVYEMTSWLSKQFVVKERGSKRLLAWWLAACFSRASTRTSEEMHKCMWRHPLNLIRGREVDKKVNRRGALLGFSIFPVHR